MDWTGGTRSRFTKISKSAALLQRQKSHFARIRTTSHTQRQSESPAQPDFLRKENGEVQLDSAERYGCHHERLGIIALPDVVEPSACAPQLHSIVPQKSDGTRPRDVNEAMTEMAGNEETRLRAYRQRLLARKDWLSLGPARPLQMNFAPSTSQEHIAKRRKVHTSLSAVERRMRQRSVTPIFDDRLLAVAPKDPTVLPFEDEEVCIRIGTDALFSHTQVSKRSGSPDINSMRPVSLDSTIATEESMLIGDEPRFCSIEFQPRIAPSYRNTSPISALQLPDCQRDERGRTYDEIASFTASRMIMEEKSLSRSPSLQPWQFLPGNLAPVAPMMVPTVSTEERILSSEEKSFYYASVKLADNLTTDEIEWRRVVDVKANTSPPISNVAANSADPDEPDSMASAWPFPGILESAVPPLDPVDHWEDKPSRLDKWPTEANRQSPRFARHDEKSWPTAAGRRPPTAPNDVSDEDAIWRQFVLGSSQSSAEDPGPCLPSWAIDSVEELIPAAEVSQSMVHTDLLPDDATVADSMLVDCSSILSLTQPVSTEGLSGGNLSIVVHASTNGHKSSQRERS